MAGSSEGAAKEKLCEKSMCSVLPTEDCGEHCRRRSSEDLEKDGDGDCVVDDSDGDVDVSFGVLLLLRRPRLAVRARVVAVHSCAERDKLRAAATEFPV